MLHNNISIIYKNKKWTYSEFFPPQKRVVREETKLLSMMPLTATSKANRTLLYSIQEEVSIYLFTISMFNKPLSLPRKRD